MTKSNKENNIKLSDSIKLGQLSREKYAKNKKLRHISKLIKGLEKGGYKNSKAHTEFLSPDKELNKNGLVKGTFSIRKTYSNENIE